MPEFEIHARGHENVRATHESTLELTTDTWLTPAGDCIVGVAADTGAADVPDHVVRACQSREARITLALCVDGHTDRITARGHPELTFADPRSMVLRTSTYCDDRTIGVGADRAAADLDRSLVAHLQTGVPLEATLAVEAS